MKKSIFKVIFVAILALGTVAPIATLATHYTSIQVEKSVNIEATILQTIASDSMFNHIKLLSKSPRVAGTEQEDAAVAYIKKSFESYGYKTEVQAFTFTDYTSPHTIKLSIDSFTKSLDPQALEYSISGQVSGEIVTAGLGKVEELQYLDLTGKIALLERGEISFNDKMSNVIAKGAIGAIFYNNVPGTIMGSLGEVNRAFVPAVLLTEAEGDELVKHINNKPSTHASIRIKGSKSQKNISHNVIATKMPTSNKKQVKKSSKIDKDIIVISAHHDSVAGAPGANDNASGSAMTLELSRVMKNIPSETEIRFITFGAEEFGLLGSTHYVANLTEDEISRITANFNLDMVGSKDAGELIMQTANGKHNLVTQLAQAASTKLNGEPTPVNQGDRSDHVPFANVGIPSALFIHNPAEPWYHKPEDKIDKISKEKLQDVAEIVSIALWNQIRIDHQVK